MHVVILRQRSSADRTSAADAPSTNEKHGNTSRLIKSSQDRKNGKILLENRSTPPPVLEPISSGMEPPAQLSREEVRLLEQCERESLIYRSVPLTICSFFAVQYAMSKNILSTRAKWLKLGAAGFAGYIIGKVSYTPACRRKLLAELPDSALAQLIRGGETRQIPATGATPHDALVFVPDAQSVPLGVNQYGDPVYKSA